MTDLDILDQIAERRATEEFIDSYIAETPAEQRRLEAMGILVAEWLDWDYKPLMIVARAAFDALDMPQDITIDGG